jgi:leader peptidase (prepilin peptidase)/N-methyltransferase
MVAAMLAVFSTLAGALAGGSAGGLGRWVIERDAHRVQLVGGGAGRNPGGCGGCPDCALGPPTGVLEGLGAVAGGLLALGHQAPPAVPVASWLLLLGAAVVLSWIDGLTHRLPDVVLGPVTVAMVAMLGAEAASGGQGGRFARALVAAAVLAGGYLLVAVLSGGLGLGDVKAAPVVGLVLGWVGWPAVLAGTVAALLGAALVGALLVVSGRARAGTRIPFGPFMLVAALAVAAL